MDFVKVFDQAVREIKREVNLKVLKVPEIEQKVLDATDNEPWGPHGSALSEIAQATKKFTECQMVMNVLWTRLGETGKDWRYVYKALAVVEYLIANGSERAVDDIIEHTFQISSLAGFEYVEPNGKDVGINVRKKAETIVGLLNNKEKIQEVRNKAASTREKYFGLSSTGVTYKSSAASFGNGSSNFRSSSNYGGFGGSYDTDTYNYKDKDENQFGEEKFEKFVPRSHQGASVERKKESTSYGSKDQKVPPSGSSKESANESSSKGDDAITRQDAGATLDSHVDDDDDDFDPRATSKSKSTANPQVDLFGESLIGDLIDAPTSVPSKMGSNGNNSSAVDLFADATFLSATPKAEGGGNDQVNVDLFASEPASSTMAPSAIDFFAASDHVVQPEGKTKDAGATDMNSFDPFAAVPLNNLNGSDPFGAFTDSSSSNPTLNPNQSGKTAESSKPFPEAKTTSPNDLSGSDPFGAFQTTPPNDLNVSDPFGAFTYTNSSSDPTPNPNQSGKTGDMGSKPFSEGKTTASKNNFQVKSGIWADSLSRGLIDLNITAPKKVSLAEVGIVGGLSDGPSQEKQKGPQPIYDMGRAMGAGSGLGRAGLTSSSSANADDIFANWSYLQK